MNDASNSRNSQPALPGRIDIFPSPTSMPPFIYGTLLFSEVLHAIIGRVPRNQTVSVIGWRVAALRNRVYPGLVEAPGEIAHGRLLTELSDKEWRLLDSFEDPKYELRKMDLVCGQTGLAYVWIDHAEAYPTPWSQRAFASTHLPAYVERCAARYSPQG